MAPPSPFPSTAGFLARDGVVRSIVALRSGPVPRSAMARSGMAVGAGFLIFLAFGSIESAVVCAAFANFLCLSDRADDLRTRVWVQAVGALLSAAAGGLGLLVAGNDPLILVTTFVLALFAGFVHGSTPGVEAIPRYAIVCFVIAAFLPVGRPGTIVAVATATVLAVTTVLVDHRLRHGRRGRHNALVRAAVTYPSPVFSVIYGGAAVFGLGLGLVWGQARPYWVTVTTLLVMQPDRRANTVRVLQRFLGTICGVLLAFAVVRVTPTVAREATLVSLVVALPFLWPFGYDRNYGLGTAILSTWILLLIDTALPGADLAAPLFRARLADTSIGCAVALAGSFFAYESREDGAAP